MLDGYKAFGMGRARFHERSGELCSCSGGSMVLLLWESHGLRDCTDQLLSTRARQARCSWLQWESKRRTDINLRGTAVWHSVSMPLNNESMTHD